jgi:hypothetical protein
MEDPNLPATQKFTAFVQNPNVSLLLTKELVNQSSLKPGKSGLYFHNLFI